MNKPYSPACDNNRAPILSVIAPLLQESRAVLEIGSGTGQHAVYFARQLPHLIWYSSDVAGNLAGIQQWLQEAGADNTPPPLDLDVSSGKWPDTNVDAVFSANTCHIMHWPQVCSLFDGVARLLPSGGLLILYGPFTFNGEFTSDSNRRFDAMLRARDPDSGLRDFEALDELAGEGGMQFRREYPMPANNHILCWEK